MKFHEILKKLRTDKNMTQEELASKLNISRQSIYEWEQGINEPSIETLKELALIFDITMNELIYGKNKHQALKKEKILFLLTSATCLFGILGSFIMIKIMTDTIPMHYDLQGNITRYSSKWESLFFGGIYLLFFGLSYVFHLYHKKENELAPTMHIGQITLLVTSLLFIIGNIWMGFTNAKNINDDYPQTITGLFFSLMIVLSIFSLPIFNKKRNPFFGFRTVFTLSNKEAWKKINYFQSLLTLTSSVIIYFIILFTFKTWNFYLIFVLLLTVFISLIYHQVLQKRLT